MIRLDTVTRSLQIKLDNAPVVNQLQVVVCYSDKSSAVYSGASQLGLTSGTTLINICSPPATGIIREIDTVSVYNNDTSAAIVSILYNDNGTTYQMVKSTIKAGESLQFTHKNGWIALDVLGSVKTDASTGIIINKIMVDLGAHPKCAGTFNITGVGLPIGKLVEINQTQGPYTGKGTKLDEIDMDQLIISGKVINSTTIQCNWGSGENLVRGFFEFGYWIGA